MPEALGGIAFGSITLRQGRSKEKRKKEAERRQTRNHEPHQRMRRALKRSALA
jgi:hypothetical protein